MMNRMAPKLLFLSLFCLILLDTAHGADEHLAGTPLLTGTPLAESVKKDLQEHNKFTAKNEEDVIKKRLEIEGATRFADWKRAAEEGIPEGQVLLATCYYYGIHVSEDHEEAVKWIRKAAGIHGTSLNVPLPLVPIKVNFESVPKKGLADAQYLLGVYHYKGIGVPSNAKEAIKWFLHAAEQGNAEAQFQLGRCSFNGWGVPEDKEEAIKWYHKAAEQGHVKSQSLLGLYYFEGTGVPEDKAEAVKWFHKAAEQDFSTAQFVLGGCYLGGVGVSKDRAEAEKWFRKAAEQGHAEARHALSSLETLQRITRMTPPQQTE